MQIDCKIRLFNSGICSKGKIALFCFLFLINIVKAQHSFECSCENYKKEYTEYNQLVEQKKFEKAERVVVGLKPTSPVCDFTKMNALLQVYANLNQLFKADSVVELVESNFRKIDNKGLLSDYYLARGFLLMKSNKYDSAFALIVNSKKLAAESKDQGREYIVELNLGYLFVHMRQPSEAVKHVTVAQGIAIRLNDAKKEVKALSALQAAYGAWYDLTEDERYIDSVKKYTQITLQLARKNNLRFNIGQTFSVMAGASFIDNDLKNVLAYTDSSIKYLNTSTDFRLLHSVFMKKCDAYIEMSDLGKAKANADSCLKYAQLDGVKIVISYAYERLYEVEKLRGNFKSSIYYFERCTQIRDSLYIMERTKAINDLEQKYNKAENEKRIQELNRQTEVDALRNRILLVLIFCAILIIITILILNRQRKLKNKQKNIEIEQRLNRARMNPHFFFNAMASLQSLFLVDSEGDKVTGYIAKFSRIMRQSLESSFNEMDTIESEIIFLTDYLELQKLRWEDKFDYEFIIDENLEIESILIPGMIIQPFVENSIEHGFKNISYKGHLKIMFHIVEKDLMIRIVDNGLGYKINSSQKQYPSRATQIINDRLYLLNSKLKTNAKFVIINDSGNQGVEIKILLPIIEQE